MKARTIVAYFVRTLRSLIPSHLLCLRVNYWTDWRSNSVVRADKFSGADVTVLQRTLTQPFDVKVIHPSRQPPMKNNPCGVNNGNCSHLGLIDSPTERVCVCPHLMRLAADNVSCEPHEQVLHKSRGGRARARRPPMAGAHLTAPGSLHFVASRRAIYWADAETDKIWSEDLQKVPVSGRNTCTNSRCAALCLYNGTARCVCPHGHLAPDGLTSIPHASFVAYSQVTQIDTLHYDDDANLNAPYPPLLHKELMRNAIAGLPVQQLASLLLGHTARGYQRGTL